MTQLSDIIPMRSIRTYDGREHRWPYLFGVELEVESVRLNGSRVGITSPEGWDVHNDASLRDGLEFVTNIPMGGITLDRALRNFYGSGFSYTNGPRTSTHIHVNMSDATVAELRSMVAIVYTIEDAIYATTEEARKWGGYSVALTEMRPLRLRNIMNAPNNRVLAQHIMPSRNNERYYGFNVNVSKHGTVEFRYFPGGPTQEELRSWIDLVSVIRTASKNHTVQQMIARIDSPETLAQFLLENLGEWAGRLINSRGIEEMYSNFETITAMATDEDNPERGGGIVTINNTLLNYVNVTLLDNNLEAITYMKESLPRAGMLSEGDWKYYLGEATGQVTRAVRQVAGRGNGYTLQQSLNDYSYNPFRVSSEDREPEDEDDVDYYDDPDDHPDEEPPEVVAHPRASPAAHRTTVQNIWADGDLTALLQTSRGSSPRSVYGQTLARLQREREQMIQEQRTAVANQVVADTEARRRSSNF